MRLVCYHLFHWVCLERHCRALPPRYTTWTSRASFTLSCFPAQPLPVTLAPAAPLLSFLQTTWCLLLLINYAKFSRYLHREVGVKALKYCFPYVSRLNIGLCHRMSIGLEQVLVFHYYKKGEVQCAEVNISPQTNISAQPLKRALNKTLEVQ